VEKEEKKCRDPVGGTMKSLIALSAILDLDSKKKYKEKKKFVIQTDKT
jgi:hypothetical protein